MVNGILRTNLIQKAIARRLFVWSLKTVCELIAIVRQDFNTFKDVSARTLFCRSILASFWFCKEVKGRRNVHGLKIHGFQVI